MEYRPSEVMDYDFCPQYWHFRKEGWVPKVANKKMIAASWSIAAHAAFAYYQTALLANAPLTAVTDAAKVASVEWLAEINHYTQHGVTFGALDVEERRQDLVKLVTKYAQNCLINAPGWRVVTCEEAFQADGNCRTDVMAEEPGGALVVVDYKVKYEVNHKWFDIQAACDEFAYQYKPLRYLYEASLTYKRPVTRHYIYMITFKPFEQVLVPYTIPEWYMKRWELDHRGWMHRLENAEDGRDAGCALPMNTTHRSPFGMCELLAACTLYNREPAHMALDFVKVPQRERRHHATE